MKLKRLAVAGRPPLSRHRVEGDPLARMIAVGASTGGPAALGLLLAGLSPDFRLPVLVAQHMTAGFGASLVAWRREQVALPIHKRKLVMEELLRDEALVAFREWTTKQDKIRY